jgi:hypothetical protein
VAFGACRHMGGIVLLVRRVEFHLAHHPITVTTVGENLAQLMYSVMMTGYMFRNAQYRMELGSSMAALPSKDAAPIDQEEVCQLAAAAAPERPPLQPPCVNTTAGVVVTCRCAWVGAYRGPSTRRVRRRRA